MRNCEIAKVNLCAPLWFALNCRLKHLLNFALLLVATSGFAQSYETVYSAHLRNGFALRHYRSEAVGDNTRLYLGADSRSGYADVPTSEIVNIDAEQRLLAAAAIQDRAEPKPAQGKAIPEIIASASERTSIDRDFIASVIRAESGFNPRARSPKGAQGLMQLMPQTAAQLGVHDAYNAEANINGGSEYLRQLLQQYRGDAQKALAAYNAGPHRVQQYGGVPPYRETRAYVSRVINEYNRKKRSAATSPTRLQAQRVPVTVSADSSGR